MSLREAVFLDRKNILIIEDEKNIARFLELELTHEGYEVSIAYDGRQGLQMATDEDFDLIILDIMLPFLNGMQVLSELRKSSSVPVIMLTAKDELTDKITGLDSGADDYMTKPFAIEELLARIRVIFKRLEAANIPKKQSDSIISIKGVILDFLSYSVKYKGQYIELTKKEFELLKYLMINKNLVITRDQILENVWGYEYIGDTNIVDVYIRYIRSKIDDRFSLKLIHTVRGVGYQIKED